MKEEMIYILDSNCMGYFLRGKENNQRSENEFVIITKACSYTSQSSNYTNILLLLYS